MSPACFPLVAVDIGNTATKLALFSCCPASGLPEPDWSLQFSTGEAPPAELAGQLAAAGDALVWRAVSVHRPGLALLTEWLAAHRPRDQFRSYERRDLPLEVRVDFPDRVGRDRLAAAVAVNRLRSAERAAIVVGAGTALTVDLVAASGAFEGGAILPGFRMSAEALARVTDLLPLALLEPQAAPPEPLGKNTEAAIRSGLFWGAVGGVRELADQYRRRLSLAAPQALPPELFLTGGDLARLAPLVGDGARFVPRLALAGVALAASVEANATAPG